MKKLGICLLIVSMIFVLSGRSQEQHSSKQQANKKKTAEKQFPDSKDIKEKKQKSDKKKRKEKEKEGVKNQDKIKAGNKQQIDKARSKEKESLQKTSEIKRDKDIKQKEKAKSSAQTEKKAKKKEGKKDKESPLTKEEQTFVEKMGASPLVSPNLFDSRAQARKYLRILIKGGHKTVNFFKGYEEKAKGEYGIAMGSAISRLDYKNKEDMKLVMEVLGEKKDYSEACSKAAVYVGNYYRKNGKDKMTKKAVSLLKDVIEDTSKTENKESEEELRLEAAHTFLILGDADNALPVIDEMAKKGYTYAIPYLFKEVGGTAGAQVENLWDKRGLEIIKNALSYPDIDIRAEAAMFLAQMGVEKDKAEEVALRIVEELKDKTHKDMGLSNESIITSGNTEQEQKTVEKVYNAGRGCDYAIEALGELNSRKAIPILQYISKNNTEWYQICDDRKAKNALESITNDGVKK